MASIKDIIDPLLAFTLYQLKAQRNVTWDVTLLEVLIVRYDTSTGVRRLVIDIAYPPAGNTLLRIYAYVGNEQYSELLYSEPFADNNESLLAFVHEVSLREIDYIPMYTQLVKYNMLNNTLWSIPTQTCATGTLSQSPVVLSAGSLSLPTSGDTVGAVLYNGNTACVLKADTTTIMGGVTMIPFVDTSLPVAANFTSALYMNAYVCITGCIANGVIYISKSSTHINAINLSTSVVTSNTAGGVPSLIRADETDTVWILAYSTVSGGYLFSRVNPATLGRTPVTLTGDTLSGTCEGGFCKNGFLYVSTSHGMFRIETATGAVEHLTAVWLDQALGYTGSTFLRRIIPLSNGRIAGILGASGGNKYLVVMTEDGDLVGSPIAVNANLDHRVNPVEISERMVVLMSPTSSGSLNISEVNMYDQSSYSYVSAVGQPTFPAHAFMGLDGRVYLPTNIGGNLPYMQRCPQAYAITAEQIARVKSYELNYF